MNLTRERLRRLARQWRGLRQEQQGQAAVELALLMPFLAVIILIVAQIFLASDVGVVTLIDAHVKMREYALDKDSRGGFEFHEVTARNKMPLLPGLDSLFRSLTGEGVERPSGRDWLVERSAAMYCGAMTGRGQNYFNAVGDGQGRGGSPRRHESMVRYFGY